MALNPAERVPFFSESGVIDDQHPAAVAEEPTTLARTTRRTRSNVAVRPRSSRCIPSGLSSPARSAYVQPILRSRPATRPPATFSRTRTAARTARTGPDTLVCRPAFVGGLVSRLPAQHGSGITPRATQSLAPHNQALWDLAETNFTEQFSSSAHRPRGRGTACFGGEWCRFRSSCIDLNLASLHSARQSKANHPPVSRFTGSDLTPDRSFTNADLGLGRTEVVGRPVIPVAVSELSVRRASDTRAVP